MEKEGVSNSKRKLWFGGEEEAKGKLKAYRKKSRALV